MKKRLIYTLYCILSVVFYSKGQSNFIRAGLLATNDTLIDLVPDTVMQSLTVHLSPYPTERDSFDLDHDGTYDVSFATYGNGGLGGGSGGCTVSALNSRVKIAARIDTAYICCPQPIAVTVALPLALGDTIDERLLYSGAAMIMSNSYGGATSTPNYYPWNGLGQRFVGVRLEYTFDTLYAWMAITASGVTSTSSLFTLTIDSYCSNKNMHNTVPEYSLLNSVILFPNPAADQVKIRFDKSITVTHFFQLYDSAGQLINTGSLLPGQQETTLDLTNLPAGNYTLQLKDNNGTSVVTRNFIISR